MAPAFQRFKLNALIQQTVFDQSQSDHRLTSHDVISQYTINYFNYQLILKIFLNILNIQWSIFWEIFWKLRISDVKTRDLYFVLLPQVRCKYFSHVIFFELTICVYLICVYNCTITTERMYGNSYLIQLFQTHFCNLCLENGYHLINKKISCRALKITI